MKTKITIITILLLLSIQTYSQIPSWAWARSGDGTNIITPNYEEGTSITTDAFGNVYMVGYFPTSTITFGSTTLINDSSGTRDIFIVKYDQSGNVIWAKSAGGTGNDYAYSVTLDNIGNIYIIGSFYSTTIIFGTDTLINADNTGVFSDIYIAKYDVNGNAIWAKSAGGSDRDEAQSVATDASGNVFVAGYFQSSSITFGSTTLSNAGGENMFIVKYGSNGNALWAKGGNCQEYSTNSVAVDGWGNVYVTAAFLCSAITFGSYTLTNSGAYDLYVVKFDNNGNVLWAKSAGGSGSDIPNSISIDASNNIYIVGSFSGEPTITFDNITLILGNNNGNMFIVKYDSNGNVIWARNPGGSSINNGFSVANDAYGNIFVAGFFENSSIIFDTTNLNNTNGMLFLAKYDGNGNPLWATSAYGIGDNYANSVTVDPNGNVYVAGWFDYSPITFGSIILTNSGNGANLFIAKLGQCTLTTTTITPSNSTAFCQGDSVILTSSIGPSYLWSNSATTETIVATSSGNYSVTITDSLGCYSISTATNVTVYPNPAMPLITPNGDTTFCIGGNVILISSNYPNYIWTPGGQTTQAILVDSTGSYTVTIIDSNNCFSTSLTIIVTVEICTDINTLFQNNNDLLIYPNPANTTLNIHLSTPSHLQITDLVGKEFYKQTLSYIDTKIDVSKWSNGIYFYQITNDKQTAQGKFVVEK